MGISRLSLAFQYSLSSSRKREKKGTKKRKENERKQFVMPDSKLRISFRAHRAKVDGILARLAMKSLVFWLMMRALR